MPRVGLGDEGGDEKGTMGAGVS